MKTSWKVSEGHLDVGSLFFFFGAAAIFFHQFKALDRRFLSWISSVSSINMKIKKGNDREEEINEREKRKENKGETNNNMFIRNRKVAIRTSGKPINL